MSVTLPSPLCLLLLLAHSAIGDFPFAYQSAPYPLTSSPHLIYSSPIDGGFLLSGFSYFTKGFDGDQSEVVFVTGPDSEKQMNNEVAAMRDQLAVSNSGESIIGDSNSKVEESAKDQPSVGNGDMPAKVETLESTSEEKSDASSATDSQKSVRENASDSPVPVNAIDGQYLPVKGSGFRAPYPLLKLGGSLSYYPQLPTSFSGFGGFSSYEPSDYLKSQYNPQPFYNQYNSYPSLFSPTFPSGEGYLVPPYPSFYQNPTFPTLSSTNFISEDSSLQSNDKPSANLMKFTEELQGIVKLDRRINTGEKAETKPQESPTNPEDPPKDDRDSTTVVAKEETTSEQSTSTEQSTASEKSTEIAAPISSSETSSTSAEPTETSTLVADEA